MTRILIAEDESRLAAFVEKGLRKQGFAVTVAEDGERALQYLTTETFDLLVLDLGLPVKDGWSVLQEISQQEKILPVIIITAMSDNGNRARALAMGAAEFVMKPFKFSDLLAQIQRLLETG